MLYNFMLNNHNYLPKQNPLENIQTKIICHIHKARTIQTKTSLKLSQFFIPVKTRKAVTVKTTLQSESLNCPTNHNFTLPGLLLKY